MAMTITGHHFAAQNYVRTVRAPRAVAAPPVKTLDVREQLLAAPTMARQSLMQEYGIQHLPPDWETMPLSDFLQWASQARGGRRVPAPSEKSPLHVRAYAYRNEEGKMVPVRTVRIHETGHYNNRQRFFNPAGYGTFGPAFGGAQTGRSYTVTVEWEDGRSQVVQVVNKGWPVEVW